MKTTTQTEKPNNPTKQDLTQSTGTTMADRTAQIHELQQTGTATFAALDWLVNLTPVERRRILKAHSDVEKFASNFVQLLRDRPELAPTNCTAQTLSDAIDYMMALSSYAATLASQLKSINDSYLDVRALVYTDVLDIYAIVQRNVKRDPSLKPFISEFRSHQSTGPRKAKTPAVHVPIVTTPAPAPSPMVNTTIVNAAPAGSTVTTTPAATPAASSNGAAGSDAAVH